MVTPRPLLIDLYELTMAASYFAEGMFAPATFELFSRRLPARRNFLIACGLETVLEHLEGFRFQPGDLAYLSSLRIFDDAFLDYLEQIRFTGEVWAVPEGEAVFPPGPVLRVTGPLIEAQIVETYLLNVIDFQTAVASKAARVQIACRGRPFVDFSARRDHGPDAALFAARASFVGGATATSNLEAGKHYRIEVSGTMAHSYVMTAPDEATAFLMFARQFPDRTTFLVDTYDTLEGARRAAAVADELAKEGITVRAVRIDSGDIAELSPKVRRILDEAGHPQIQIFVSGDLDEYKIDALLAPGAPIDGFGVGTEMGTSGDAPSLGGAYKLVQDHSGPKLKRSPGKATMPGVKQVYRTSDAGGYNSDLIALADEPAPAGARGLLEPVMRDGRPLREAASLPDIQKRCKATLESLPERLRSLDVSGPYPVVVSERLQRLTDSMGLST